MKLEIVSHCWNYSRLLTYQLSSLVLYPPSLTEVCMTVFFCEEDARTTAVVDFFKKETVPQVTWHWWPLPRKELLRRAIGMNYAALANQADWIWFTDCDMCFRGGALDSLPAAVEGQTDALLYPRPVLYSKDFATGDATIARLSDEPKIVDIDPEEFQPLEYDRAIGGVQIVRGGVAREMGYCKNTRFQWRARRWKREHEDWKFRNILGAPGTPIVLPNVFRISHSKYVRRHRGVLL